MKAATTDVEREVIRQALLAIVSANNGVLNPHRVLEVARDPNHVLHPQFEWDNEAAGEAYRLAQVGALARRLRVTVIRENRETRQIQISTTRGLQSRPSMRTSSGGYEPIDALLADADKRSELFAQVLRELSSYRRRYAELIELEQVWVAVDDVVSEHTRPSASAPDAEARPGAAG